MAEPTHDPLMQEIEEELRQEQMKKLWAAYGKYVIALVVLVVVVVAGYQGWQAYDRSIRLESTDRLLGAERLVQQGDAEAAITVLEQMASDAGGGVKLLAKMRKAGLLAENGDHAAAAEAYQAIAADAQWPAAYRDLATVLAQAQLLDADPGNAEAVLQRLDPMTDANAGWRHSAREIAAVAALELGRTEDARAYLEAIALDAQTPPALRARADEMLRAISP